MPAARSMKSIQPKRTIVACLLASSAALGSAQTLQFPETSVGRLYVREPGRLGELATESWWAGATGDDLRALDEGAKWEAIGAARGALEKPAGKDLRLVVDNAAVKDLAWLGAIPDGAIQSLNLADTDADDASLAAIAGWARLGELILKGADVGDAGMAHVKGLKELRGLDLANTFVTDAGLEALAGLSELRTLVLDGTDVTGAGLAHLAGLGRLEKLGLANTKIEDATFDRVVALTGLRSLDISATPISNEKIADLTKLANLEELALGGENQAGLYFEPLLNNQAVAPLLELKNLRRLTIAASITNEGVARLAGATGLERLILIGSKFNDEGVGHLARHPNLKNVFFISPPESRVTVPIAGEGLAQLKRIEGLKGLGLRDTNVVDADLIHLRDMTSLEFLSLDSPGVGDAGLEHVAGLSSLRVLHLPMGATDAGLARIAGLTNLRRLRAPLTSISDAGIKHLGGLSRLEALDLYGTPIGAGAVEILKTMKSLRVLHVGFTEIGEAGLAELRRELPLCDVRDN
jgi:hypothetical protein